MVNIEKLGVLRYVEKEMCLILINPNKLCDNFINNNNNNKLNIILNNSH